MHLPVDNQARAEQPLTSQPSIDQASHAVVRAAQFQKIRVRRNGYNGSISEGRIGYQAGATNVTRMGDDNSEPSSAPVVSTPPMVSITSAISIPAAVSTAPAVNIAPVACIRRLTLTAVDTTAVTKVIK